MESKDNCDMFCGGKNVVFPLSGRLQISDIQIKKEKNRGWYFSYFGNYPNNPKIALVSLCPAHTQLKYFVELYNKNKSFEESATNSGFQKMRKNIAKILRRKELDKYLGLKISDDFDFNNNDNFLVTSLVKCASTKEGKGRSNQYDLLKYDCSRLCIINRFINEILRYKSIEKIVIFGKVAEKVVKEVLIENKSTWKILNSEGREIIFVPHPSTANNKAIKIFLSN